MSTEHGLSSLAAMDAVTQWGDAVDGRFLQIEFMPAEWVVTLFLEDAEGAAAGLESPFTVSSEGTPCLTLAAAVDAALKAFTEAVQP